MDERQVVERVSHHLEKWRPGGAELRVVSEGIQKRDGCWYVPVLPSYQPPRNVEYYDALAEVETELSDEGLDALLVPVIPEEAAA